MATVALVLLLLVGVLPDAFHVPAPLLIVPSGVLVAFWVVMMKDHLVHGQRGIVTFLLASLNLTAAVVYFWTVVWSRTAPQDAVPTLLER